MQGMIHYWWPVHEGPHNIQFSQTETRCTEHCSYRCEWLIVVQLIRLMSEFVREAVSATKKVQEWWRESQLHVFFPHFSASFFSLLLLFCLRPTQLPPLTPLHSSRRVLGWELSSAAVWARDGSEDGEGAGQAERDLMRMYGCGCMCVSFFWQTHARTPPISWLSHGKSGSYLGSNIHRHDHTHL